MKRKAMACGLMLLLVCCLLGGCAALMENFSRAVQPVLRDDLSREEIFRLVTENRELLLEAAGSGSYEAALELSGIRSVHAEKDGSYIDFYCGGYGFASATGYAGFYYSPTGAPLGMSYAQTESLAPEGEGYGWRQPDGDNSYYTQEICEGFFCYEAHF